MREEIGSGRATLERKLAVCTGSASLAPEDRIEALAILASDANEMIREKASNALLTQPVAAVLSSLARPDVAPQLFAYCAAEFPSRPGIADALAANPSCPVAVLRTVVSYLSVSAVQDLFEDLDRLSTSSSMVTTLLTSAVLNAEQRSQLLELERATPDPKESFTEIVEIVEPDRARRETLLQKLSRMRVVERVQMAIKGSRDERLLLINDHCKVVQRAVLQSPQITEREVEGFAGMRGLSEDVLRIIGTNRKYLKNYGIVRTLINNPKTPLEITLHLLPTIAPQDLKLLAANKNIPETLRTAAGRLMRHRATERSRT